MILIVVLSLLISLFLWILFVPFFIVVDTDHQQYEVRQPGVFRFAAHPGSTILFTMDIFGINIPVTSGASAKKPVPRKSSARKFRRSLDTWKYLAEKILKSFRVKTLRGTIDFGDVVVNAQLIPVFLFLSRGPVRLTTNFRDENALLVTIEGRLNKIVWAFIVFLLKK